CSGQHSRYSSCSSGCAASWETRRPSAHPCWWHTLCSWPFRRGLLYLRLERWRLPLLCKRASLAFTLVGTGSPALAATALCSSFGLPSELGYCSTRSSFQFLRQQRYSPCLFRIEA